MQIKIFLNTLQFVWVKNVGTPKYWQAIRALQHCIWNGKWHRDTSEFCNFFMKLTEYLVYGPGTLLLVFNTGVWKAVFIKNGIKYLCQFYS